MQRRVLARKYGGAGVSLLLDEYPNAAVAYSLRELSTASVGSAVVRVRRSDNNEEQDFTATEITDGTLETFVGAGNDGFVTTWYDQSGNGQDAVQATANTQPKIVDNGVLILNNSNPACIFNRYWLNTSFFLTPNLTTGVTNFLVFEHISQLFSYDFLYSIGNGAASISQRLSQFATTGSTNNPVSYNFAAQSTTNEIDTPFSIGQKLHVGLSKSEDCRLYLNGNLEGTSTNSAIATSNTPFRIRLGAPEWDNSPNSIRCNAYIQEFILYNTDQSTNRTGIEIDINNHYSIY